MLTPADVGASSVDDFLDGEIRAYDRWCDRRGRTNGLETRLDEMMREFAERWRLEDAEDANVKDDVVKQITAKTARAAAAAAKHEKEKERSVTAKENGSEAASVQVKARVVAPTDGANTNESVTAVSNNADTTAILETFGAASLGALPAYEALDKIQLVNAAMLSYEREPPQQSYLSSSDAVDTAQGIMRTLIKKGHGNSVLRKLHAQGQQNGGVAKAVRVLKKVLATLHDDASAGRHGPADAAVRLYKQQYAEVLRMLHQSYVDALTMHALRVLFCDDAAWRNDVEFNAACEALIDANVAGLGPTQAARDALYLAYVNARAIHPIEKTVVDVPAPTQLVVPSAPPPASAVASEHHADPETGVAPVRRGGDGTAASCSTAVMPKNHDWSANLASVMRGFDAGGQKGGGAPPVTTSPATRDPPTTSLHRLLYSWAGRTVVAAPLPQPRMLARRLICGIFNERLAVRGSPRAGDADALAGYLLDEAYDREGAVACSDAGTPLDSGTPRVDASPRGAGGASTTSVGLRGGPRSNVHSARAKPSFAGGMDVGPDNAGPAAQNPTRRGTNATHVTEFTIASSPRRRGSSHFSIDSSDFPASELEGRSPRSIYDSIYDALEIEAAGGVGRQPTSQHTSGNADGGPQMGGARSRPASSRKGVVAPAATSGARSHPSSATRRLSREVVEASVANAVASREDRATHTLARRVVVGIVARALHDAGARDAADTLDASDLPPPAQACYIAPHCVNDGICGPLGLMVHGGRTASYPPRLLRLVRSAASVVVAAAVAAYVAAPVAIDDDDVYAMAGAVLVDCQICDVNGVVEKYRYNPTVVRLMTAACRYYATPTEEGHAGHTDIVNTLGTNNDPSGATSDADPSNTTSSAVLVSVFAETPQDVVLSVLSQRLRARFQHSLAAATSPQAQRYVQHALAVAAAFTLFCRARQLGRSGGVTSAHDVFVPTVFGGSALAAIDAVSPIVRELAEMITQLSPTLQARLMRDALTRLDRGAPQPPLPFNILAWARALKAIVGQRRGMKADAVWDELCDSSWRREALAGSGGFQRLLLPGCYRPGSDPQPVGGSVSGVVAESPSGQSRHRASSVGVGWARGGAAPTLFYEAPHGQARGTDADLAGVVYVVMVEWGRPIRGLPQFWKQMYNALRMCAAGRLPQPATEADAVGRAIIPRLHAALVGRDARVVFRTLCSLTRAVERSADLQDEWKALAVHVDALPFQVDTTATAPPAGASTGTGAKVGPVGGGGGGDDAPSPSPRRGLSRRASFMPADGDPGASPCGASMRRRSTIGMRRKSLGTLVATLKHTTTAGRRRRSLFGADDPTWGEMDAGADDDSDTESRVGDAFNTQKTVPPCPPERRQWCRVLGIPPVHHHLPAVAACQYYSCYFRAFLADEEEEEAAAAQAEEGGGLAMLSPRRLDAYREAYVRLVDGDAGVLQRRGSLMHILYGGGGGTAGDGGRGIRWRRATQRIVAASCPFSIRAGGVVCVDLRGIAGFGGVDGAPTDAETPMPTPQDPPLGAETVLLDLGDVVNLAVDDILSFEGYETAHSAALFVEILAQLLPGEAFRMDSFVHPLKTCASELLDSLAHDGSAEDFITHEIANCLLVCLREAARQRARAKQVKAACRIQRAWRCRLARRSRAEQEALDFPTMGLFKVLVATEAAKATRFPYARCLREANTAVLPKKLQKKREAHRLDALEHATHLLQQRADKLVRPTAKSGSAHHRRAAQRHLTQVAEVEMELIDVLAQLLGLMATERREAAVVDVLILLCRVLVVRVGAEKTFAAFAPSGRVDASAAVEAYFNDELLPLLREYQCVHHGAPVAFACSKACFEHGHYTRADTLCQQATLMVPRHSPVLDEIEEFRTACSAVRTAPAVAQQARDRSVSPAPDARPLPADVHRGNYEPVNP